jgi:tight adherence protein B
MSEPAHLLVVLVLLLVSAGAIASALAATRAMRHQVDRRTALVSEALPDQTAMAESGRVRGMKVLNEKVRNIFALGLRFRWGMHASAALLIAIAFAGAAAMWLLSHTFLHFSVWTAGPLAAAAWFFAPRQILKRQQDRAEREFMDLFPASIDMIVRMVRAGLTITGAIRAVGNEAPPPVNEVFTSLADQVDIGIMFTDALATAGERIGMADFRFFAVAVSLQHATGGNITSTLEILSSIVRKRRLARLKAKATTGEVRVSAYVLGSLPFVVIAGLLVMSPSYLAPLIDDPRGNAIVGAAIILLLMGFGTMRQMMRSATRF